MSPSSSLPNDPSNAIPSPDLHELKTSSPLTSSSSSTANSPSNELVPSDQKSILLPVPPPPPSSSTSAPSLPMFPGFVPSLLMQTANDLHTEIPTNNLVGYSTSLPFSLLHHRRRNYQNWLMLREIVHNNDFFKQFRPTFPVLCSTANETEQENNDEDDSDKDHDTSDENPLDLSIKIDSNRHGINQAPIKVTNNKLQISTKQTKTALTPLREQDTSKYRHIDTTELVQTVKDILSRYSISQRHFGEKILGLSQGSVR